MTNLLISSSVKQGLGSKTETSLEHTYMEGYSRYYPPNNNYKALRNTLPTQVYFSIPDLSHPVTILYTHVHTLGGEGD